MYSDSKLDVKFMYYVECNIKVRLSQATVESILLHGAETWTTNKIQKSLDGCYTRMHA